MYVYAGQHDNLQLLAFKGHALNACWRGCEHDSVGEEVVSQTRRCHGGCEEDVVRKEEELSSQLHLATSSISMPHAAKRAIRDGGHESP